MDQPRIASGIFEWT